VNRLEWQNRDSTKGGLVMMLILLWLLGVPVGLIIILWLIMRA